MQDVPVEDVPMEIESEESSSDGSSSEENETSESLLSDSSLASQLSKIPTVLPRLRYSGHCNIETVKDGIVFDLQFEYYLTKRPPQ